MPQHPSSLRDAEQLRVATGEFVRRARAADTMPRGQASVLGYLARQGDLAIVDLAELDRVRHQSMARTVKLLAEQGLVQLCPDDDDRRRVTVSISRAGRRALEAERRNRSSWIADAIEANLSPSERALLRQVPELLAKLTQGSGST